MPAQQPFDPVLMLDMLSRRTPRTCAFTATAPAAAKAWQKKTRRAVAKLVGFQDLPAVELKPRIEQSVDRGDYIRQRVVIQTSPWSAMPIYVLIPKRPARPLPCALAFHGHGYGAKDIVGLWEDGSERMTPEGYHKDYACELAKRGILTLAPEISCFGERTASYSHLQPNQPKPTTCHGAATYAMMLGSTALGLRLWDAMRAVDYLQTLTGLADVNRLGAMGISGGGMHCFFSTALDTRIKACVVSGYFCDWQHSILSMNHCICNFIPGILKIGELSDLAGLIAPRPCLVENANHDQIFPLKHVKKTVATARKAWQAFGKTKDLEEDYFEGRHQIGGNRAYDFLLEKLK